jgi:acyl-CoA thioesterase-1
MLGEKDALISVATAEKFRDAQKAVGVRSELTVYKGQAHGFYNREPYRQLTTSAMLTFIESIGWLRKTDPALLPILETPGLPRVLVIGDSISMGYTLPLRKLLDGKANVVHPPVNCSSTAFGLKELDSWLGAKPWDVIHVNFGLHDLKYLNAEGQLVSPEKGTLIADPTAYEANLRLLVQRLKATKAKIVWGMTTPVPSGATGRVAGSDTVYNAVARKVMTEFGIPVNDLHTVITSAPTGLQQPRNVHFTPAGYDALAAAVQKVVLPLLPVGK